MALDFPTSPTNGQYYNGFVYNAANETWDSAYAPRAATIPISSPNYIINGAMEINQRGTVTTTNGVLNTIDRFYNYSNGTGTFTHSQQDLGPAEVVDSAFNFTKAWKIQTPASLGTSTAITFGQKIENVSTLAGGTATLSFWARATLPVTLFSISARQNFGSGGSTAVSTTAASSVSLGSAWTKYVYTFDIPSIDGKTIGANNCLQIEWAVTSLVASSAILVTGVQVEAGAAATDFRRNAPSIQGELAACQRYYTRFSNVNSAATIGLGTAYGTGNLQCFMNLPVTMRTTPSAEVGPLAGISWEGGTSSGNTPTGFSVRAFDVTPNVLAYELSKISGWASDGRAYHIHLNTTSGAYLAASAEL